MHTQTPELTHQLFDDLLNEHLTTFQICHKHQLAIDQLAAVVDSPAFQSAARALERIHDARAAAMLPELRTRALTRLADVVAQTPTTPTHTETIRRAASAILRWKSAPPQPDDRPDKQPDERPTDAKPAGAPPEQPPERHEPSGRTARHESSRPPEPLPTAAHARSPDPLPPAAHARSPEPTPDHPSDHEPSDAPRTEQHNAHHRSAHPT